MIYSRFGVIQKPVSGSIVCKSYISININLLSYKKWKQVSKISNTALILLPWVKVLFLQKKTVTFCKKNAVISKIKRAFAFIFWNYKCLSTYIPNLQTYKQRGLGGGGFTPSLPHRKINPKKPMQIRVNLTNVSFPLEVICGRILQHQYYLKF